MAKYSLGNSLTCWSAFINLVVLEVTLLDDRLPLDGVLTATFLFLAKSDSLGAFRTFNKDTAEFVEEVDKRVSLSVVSGAVLPIMLGCFHLPIMPIIMLA